MDKKILATIILLPTSLALFGQLALSEQHLSLGGGIVGSTPQMVGVYRWESVELRAGLGISESENVFSTGVRYHFDSLKLPVAQPYLGTGVLYSVKGSTSLSPPPPPSPDSSGPSSPAGNKENFLLASLTGGFELSFTVSKLPFTLWSGVYYLPGSEDIDQNSLDNYVSIGLTLNF